MSNSGILPSGLIINTPRSAEILTALHKFDDDTNITDTDFRVAIVNFLFVKLNETMANSTLQEFKKNLEFLSQMIDVSLSIQNESTKPTQGE